MPESPQQDRFIHDRLPHKERWPEFILPPGVPETGRLNCTHALLDQNLAAGRGNATALMEGGRAWSYSELNARACRIANVLMRDFGVMPGNRVLLRGPNSLELAAVWLAVQKAGAVAVTTMPLLRASELATIIRISRPALAVSDASVADALEQAIESATEDCPLLSFASEGGELAARAARHSDDFTACPTLADDISLIAFTSGTTGKPKATVHFHRDIIAICETVSRYIICPRDDDIFIGTPPLAFTFGLGGLLVFPLYAGAAGVLHGRYTARELLDAIDRYHATVCFTVPTFYQRMARETETAVMSSLRLAVSSGEALPVTVRRAWRQAAGLDLTELLGSTEMLHAFIGATGNTAREGFIGRAVPGYELAILGEDGRPLPPGKIGRLAVKGPTGCRYLDDPRQNDYVQNGWNITGDACAMDADGYVSYHFRLDELIISAGYNISALEVENALLTHPGVAECAVVGTPDPERGQAVTAFVVPEKPPDHPDHFIEQLQAYARETIAPYKYPRRVELVDALPRNASGKLQRFRLRA